MKILSYTLAQKAFLQKLQSQNAKRETEISSATAFVKEIEKGNLEVRYSENEENHENIDGLAASLISMRNQMKKFSQEELERNWATEGLAKFVDILRSKNENLNDLADNIIGSLIRYMKANQGALYLINDDNAADVHIEMAACYAYNRKKYMNQRIELGQGLAGQVVLEKETLYLTDIPSNYVKITSGLGEALPRNLLMVPLKLEDKIYGLVEVASFDTIKSYQIDFVKKLGESIASTISSVKINERTKKLLTETQEQAEQMRSQEEEMRQNMEELSATQEEMQRIIKEVQGQEAYMNELINSSSDSILVVDKEYKVISANAALQKSYAGLGFDVVRGFDAFKLFSDAERPKYRSYYDRTLAGENFQLTEHYKSHGFDTYFLIQYTPIRNGEGEVTAAAVFAKDISDMIAAKNKAEALAHDSQQRNEELKAQEEELRQNMEELSATQDEMQRVLAEVQNSERDIAELINVTSDSILTMDREFKVVRFNKVFSSTFESKGLSVGKGFDILNIFNDEEKKRKRELYNRVFAGEELDLLDHLDTNGFDNYFNVKHAPLRDTNGEINAIAIFAKDVTELYKAKQKAEASSYEAQQRNEEMKAQEEELRQNMEELSATQDEMQRVLTMVQEKETYLNNLVNAYNDAILAVDLDCKIVMFNSYIANTFQQQGLTLQIGMDALLLSHEGEREHSKENYTRAFAGETVVENQEYFGHHYEISTIPLKDNEGKVIGATVFTKDITNSVLLMNESQQKTEEMKAQEEELRQNMEELSATQEEMERILLEVQAKEGYLNEVINAAKDSIFTLDKDFKVISSNKAFSAGLEALGMKVEKGFDIMSLFQHDKKELKKQQSYYGRALAGETFETTDRSELNGVESYYNVNYSPLKRENGEVFAIAVFAKEVTEIMKAKEATEQLLQESKNQQVYFNDIINGLGDSVLTVDKDFKIIVANNTFKKVFSRYGVSTEPGDNLLAMAKNGDVDEFKKPYLRAFKGETVEVAHRHHFDRDFHVYYHPLKDGNGKIIGVSLIAHDITERLQMQKKTEELLKEARAEKERADKEIKEYKQRVAALEKKTAKSMA